MSTTPLPAENLTAAGSADAILIGAMEEETGPVFDLADESGPTRTVGGTQLTRARFGARIVLVVGSGIGLANAASAATIALLEAGPCPVLSVGSAGGIGRDVKVGQIAIGTEYRYSKADARGFGYELGQVPQMPVAFVADRALAAAARTAAAVLDLETAEGLVLSSDVFVTPDEATLALAAFPAAVSVDMESAAIAHVAHRFAAPFCAIRAISDLCGPDAGGDFDRHIDGAAARSASLAAAIVQSGNLPGVGPVA